MNNQDMMEIIKIFKGKYIPQLMLVGKNLTNKQVTTIMNIAESISQYNSQFFTGTDLEVNFTEDGNYSGIFSGTGFTSIVVLIAGMDYSVCVEHGDADGFKKLVAVQDYIPSYSVSELDKLTIN